MDFEMTTVVFKNSMNVFRNQMLANVIDCEKADINTSVVLDSLHNFIIAKNRKNYFFICTQYEYFNFFSNNIGTK